MKNLLSNFAKEQTAKIQATRGDTIADFNVGDTVSVKYKITEGANTRIQAFNGTVIAKTKSASNYAATFTVRKVSSGIGVERKFTYRWSLFLQPIYRRHFLIDGIGPNEDRIHSSSLRFGAKVKIR